MSRLARGPVVIDTGIFGARLARIDRPFATAYQPLIEGRARIISFIAVAELHYGANLAKWGAKRLQEVKRSTTPTISAGTRRAITDLDLSAAYLVHPDTDHQAYDSAGGHRRGDQ
jgi:hypothetical protein